MTKSVSFDLKAEYSGALSQIATFMRIERSDGRVFCFTTHDSTLEVDGETYFSAASFSPTDIESGGNMETDNLTVEGILSSDSITEDDLRAGRWDYAQFRIFQACWSNLALGVRKLRAGRFGEVSVHRNTFTVELLGMMNAYDTNIINLTSPLCRTSLGTELCGVNIGAGSPGFPPVTGTIDTADSDFFTLHDAARTEPDAFFDEGVITFTSGDNVGISLEVKAYIVGLWITKLPFPYDATGATYTMTRGCDRRFSTCCNVFNNGARFRGEPWLRGNDALVQVGRHED